MDVYQCPECRLKFRLASELDDHLRLDHPDFHAEPKTLEDELIAAAHPHRRRRPTAVPESD